MSEQFIQGDKDALPYLVPVPQREAYRAFVRRKSRVDIDWFIGHPDSLSRHPLGYERDELTPSHQAVMLNRKVWGARGSLAKESFIAYKSLIVPDDVSEEGMEAFVHDKLSGRPVGYRQYGHVLISEVGGFRHHAEAEEDYMFRLPQTGLTLAALAVNHHLNGFHFTDLIDSSETQGIREAHKEAQTRLHLVHTAEAERIKSGIKYFF